jgi:hypothetical protein
LDFKVNIFEKLLEKEDSFKNGLLRKTVLFKYSDKNYSNIKYLSETNIRILPYIIVLANDMI